MVTTLSEFVEFIRNDIAAIRPYESTGQWEKRQQFLMNLLRRLIADSNGDVAKLKKELPRIAVLSASFYNVKILGCRYADDVQDDIGKDDPERTDYAIRVEREQNLEKCSQLKCDVSLF